MCTAPCGQNSAEKQEGGGGDLSSRLGSATICPLDSGHHHRGTEPLGNDNEGCEAAPNLISLGRNLN